MARKRGEYQKRKKHQELVKDVFSILTVVFVALVLILLIINDSIAIKQIQRGTLKEYTFGGLFFCCNLLHLPIKTEKVTTKENEMLINYWETLCLNYTKNHY